MSKIYVAYGSNLNVGQMSIRCPDAVLVDTGYLRNWILVYRGGSRSGGVATVLKNKGSFVPVALWAISDSDEEALDRYEGFPWLYSKQNVYVHLSRCQRRILGMMYVMTPSFTRPARPSERYVETIKEGYQNCNLDLRFFQDSLELNKKELTKGRR